MEEGVAEVEEVLNQSLPQDLIVHNILTRVPIKSMLQFKCVSKQWCTDLSSSHFARLYSKLSVFCKPSSSIQHLFIQHENSYYILLSRDDCDEDDIGTPTFDVNKNLFKFINSFHVDEKLVLIRSCNGLVCLASFSDYFLILWNTITGKFRKYSDLEVSADSSSPIQVSWGFGYVSSVDDFKVTRVIELLATLEIKVHVFSLKFKKWKRIAEELYQDIFSLSSPTYGRFQIYCDLTKKYRYFPYSFYLSRGVLANETLYWIVSKMDGRGNKIVAFDLVGEVFDANVGLDFFSDGCHFLCNMGGCVTKYGNNMRNDVNIHIFKYPGKVKQIFLFRDLLMSCCEDLVGFTKTGKFFIQRGDSEFGLVDSSSNPKKYTRLVNFQRLRSTYERTGYMTCFVPSLTLPY